MMIPITQAQDGRLHSVKSGRKRGRPLNIRKQMAALHRAAARKANELEVQRAAVALKLANLDRELAKWTETAAATAGLAL